MSNLNRLLTTPVLVFSMAGQPLWAQRSTEEIIVTGPHGKVVEKWSQPTYLTDKQMAQPKTMDQYIFSRMLAAKEGGKKAAYMIDALRSTYFQARAEKASTDELKKRLQDALADSKSSFDAYEFKGSLWSNGAKAVSKAAIAAALAESGVGGAAGAAGNTVAGGIADETINYLGRKLDRPGLMPELTTNEATTRIFWLLDQCARPKSGFCSLMRRDFVNLTQVDPKDNSSSNLTVAHVRNTQRLRQEIRKLDPKIADMLDRMDKHLDEVKEELNDETSEKINELKESVKKDTKNAMTASQAEAELKQVNRENLAAAFSALSGIAQLTGNPKAASFLNNAGDLTMKIYDFNHLSSTARAAAGYMALNICVSAVMLAASLADSGQQSGFAAILAAIQEIRQILVEFRDEMRVRLAALEFKMDQQQEQLLNGFSSVYRGQQFEMNFLNYMAEQQQQVLSQVSLTADSGLKLGFVPFIGACQHAGLASDEKLSDCAAAYLALGQGEFQAFQMEHQNDPTVFVTSSSDSPSSSFFELLLRSFRNQYPADPIAQFKIPQPSQWLWGDFYLQKMADNYPSKKAIIKQDYNMVGTDLSAVQLLLTGQNLQTFMRKMAVDDNNHLRTDLFKNLISRYADSTKSLLDNFKNAQIAQFKGLPVPSPNFQNPPNWETKFDVYNPGYSIQFCDDAKNKKVLPATIPDSIWRRGPDVGHYISSGFAARSHSDWMSKFSTTKIPVTPNVIANLPPAWLWALTFKPLNAHLDICFERLEVTKYIPFWANYSTPPFPDHKHPKYAHITLLAEIEYRLKYTNPEDNSQKELRHRLIGQTEATGELYVPNSVDNHNPTTHPAYPGLVEILWNGWKWPYPRGDHFDSPLKYSINQWLSDEGYSQEEAKKQNQFLNDYRNALSKINAKVQKQLQSAHTTNADKDATDIKNSLLFLVNYGIAGDSPNLDKLNAWLAEPLHMIPPSRYLNSNALTTGAMSADQMKSVVEEEKGEIYNILDQLDKEQIKQGPALFQAEINRLERLIKH